MKRAATILLILSFLALSGCRWTKLKLGLGYTVETPESETPEWVVQQVLKAASMEPFEDAWAEYSKYLHSTEKDSVAAMQTWETLKFKALRNKHAKFIADASKTSYVLMEEREERDDYTILFVKITTSDMPTPCHLFKDPNEGGKWRVKMNCLN